MNFIPHTPRWLLAAAAAVALLTACGGGGLGSGGTGAAAYGTAIGTVEGFGSIFIGGERCDDLRARVSYDTVTGGPEPANPDIRLGQRIEADLDTGASTCRILAARIAPEIVGVVDSVTPLTVAGTPVLVNADPALGPVTVFDGYDSAADIQAGDRVEVHGKAVPSAGSGVAVRATRIERKPSSDTWVRVAGVVANLTSTQFTLGGLTVLYDANTTIVPAGATLRDGLTIAMWSAGPVVNNTATARFIRVLRRQFVNGQNVRLAGPVSGCGSTSPCTEPVIDGVTVQITADTNFLRGTPADVIDGVALGVGGTFDAGSGKLVANNVIVRRADPDRGLVTLIGTVSEYAVAGSETHFRVRGVPVTTDNNTTVQAGCTVDDGKVVAIAGQIEGASVRASRVACTPLAVGVVVDAYGRINNLDPANKTFQLASGPLFSLATLEWDDNTIFNNGLTAATLANDQYVLLRGEFLGNGRFLLKRVILDETRPTSPTGGLVFGTLGIANRVTPTSLYVNGIPMTIVPGTTSLPGPISNGMVVRAWFYRDIPNGRWVALRVRQVVW